MTVNAPIMAPNDHGDAVKTLLLKSLCVTTEDISTVVGEKKNLLKTNQKLRKMQCAIYITLCTKSS